ncbi:MAG: ribosome maturation factor RimP [Bryobacterales bacterium]|nr:ribosome maturation factor RimP [Bryobacterales bacterium]
MSQQAKTATVAKVQEIADQVGASEGIEIVDVELLGGGAHRVLRIFIDKEAGVTHADCELVSNLVGAALDEQDIIPGGQYTLEVSSPGVERKLKTLRDFSRFAGKKAKILLREPLEDRRQWEGLLAGIEEDRIVLEPKPGRTIRFALDQVERANLKFDW